jgi:telomerase reverse transcriptase
VHRGENAASAIPGVLSIHPNGHVTSIKADPWPRILGLMGKEGERTMIDLLLDCGIFLAVESGRGTYHQLSGESKMFKFIAYTNETGHPLGDLQTLPTKPSIEINTKHVLKVTVRSPSNITFVRNRMMHARAAMNKQGGIRFGLRHIREHFRSASRSPLTKKMFLIDIH